MDRPLSTAGRRLPDQGFGIHPFKYSGNWKVQLENRGDGYHFPIVHRSWMATVDAETADMLSFMTDPASTCHDLGSGHSVMHMVPEHMDLDAGDGTEPLQPRLDGLVAELKAAGVDDGKIRKQVHAMHSTGSNLNLFPNVGLSSAFFRVLRQSARTRRSRFMTMPGCVLSVLRATGQIVRRRRLRIVPIRPAGRNSRPPRPLSFRSR